MSAPLGTFNSEERVQISTAIRLARQLPPGRERAPLALSLSLSFPSFFLFVSCTLILVSFAAVSFFPFVSPTYRVFEQRVRVAFGVCIREIPDSAQVREVLAGLMDTGYVGNW